MVLPLNTFFSFTLFYCSFMGCFKNNFWLLVGGRIFNLRKALGEASIDLKTRLADTEIENKFSYSQPTLSIPYKAGSWHKTSHWDPPENSLYCNVWRRILSFQKWFSNLKQTPQGLSEAGFSTQVSLCVKNIASSTCSVRHLKLSFLNIPYITDMSIRYPFK